MIAEIQELLPPGEGEVLRVAMFRRKGRLQLVLPVRAASARVALELYPAQRTAARLIRWILKSLCRLHLPLPLHRDVIPIRNDDDFVSFLRSLTRGGTLELAILAGNPGAEGRRWLCLVFADGTPVAVVKAGVSPAAKALIAKELDFLTTHTPPHAALPIEKHASTRVSAFALPFIPEHGDRQISASEAFQITDAWLKPDARSLLSARPAFRALSSHVRDDREQKLLEAAGRAVVAEALMHGDFAPWNLKRDRRDGQLRVLDWERGDACGIPGWDMLHFIIQPLVLVHRACTDHIAATVIRFLSEPEWAAFAERAGIAETSPLLVWTYLLHAARAQPQSEGGKIFDEILHHFTHQCAAG